MTSKNKIRHCSRGVKGCPIVGHHQHSRANAGKPVLHCQNFNQGCLDGVGSKSATTCERCWHYGEYTPRQKPRKPRKPRSLKLKRPQAPDFNFMCDHEEVMLGSPWRENTIFEPRNARKLGQALIAWADWKDSAR